MTTKVIGFAGTYYTAWTIDEEYRPLGNGRTYKVLKYNYYKNLSKDPNIAREKWGTDDIDMDLHGSKSFERVFDKPEEVAVDCFPFGRSKGQKYDSESESYLSWYYNEELNEERRNIVADILIKDYGWVRDGSFIWSPEDWAANKVHRDAIENTKKLVHGKDPIKFTAKSSLNEYGEMTVYEDGIDLWVNFKNFRKMYYQGWEYGLPLDNKGVAKRIKNKTVIIKSWKVIDDKTIEVIDWEMKK